MNLPKLQMNDLVQTDCGDIAEVEEPICDGRENEEEEAGQPEEGGPKVRLLSCLRCGCVDREQSSVLAVLAFGRSS